MDSTSRGVETWKEHTTAFERVQSVTQTLDQPRTVSYIATEAAVAESTARRHLKRLVEINIVQSVAGESATRYEPDPLYSRFQAVRELIENESYEELVELKTDIQQRIEEFAKDSSANSPSDLRAQAATTETAATTRHVRDRANEWETLRHRISIVNTALDAYQRYPDRAGANHSEDPIDTREND
ncbi:winged helix-turn-helix domain-containing protein [Halorubrum sp. DM2]|uniref:winged helix-turn-helix domain-containing protein n=1 Tax=Halorubrum sp. DM2 TaxID=2527867 RepID=UPI0024B65F25|nr:winged helix-turn-helix domain-containing protein [Halorubrum sp. DM2]